MGTIFFLIGFPLVIAVALLVLKADAARDWTVRIAALAIACVSVWFAVTNFGGEARLFDFHNEAVNYAMMAIEVCLAVVIIILGIKYKKYAASVLAAIQTPVMVWFEFRVGHHIAVENNLYADKLSLIMVLIIGIIGTLICVYALPYMKDFQHHHHGEKDRRPWFFFLLFLFLSAMFGIVLSNNLLWLYFFWEITTLCSFFLIGYTKTKEAVDNSFRALIFNLIGGVAFVLAIVASGAAYQTLELNVLLSYGAMFGPAAIAIPVTLLAFAGLTKAAQMPFSSWLLGAMVAPTPTSALLHSSTMVKAGVFLIIKLSPALGFGWAGMLVMTVGGLTFLFASFAAISQSNAKRVLAYSTIANLGLIVACAGVGAPEAVWAAIMLVIFHAVTKSLLFLCVGTAEHNLGSRDIEDMDGLFEKMPRLALFMIVGIAGMFLAPMGMLVSKWEAMISFVDSPNFFLIAIICFGSAATFFYWTKWLGKMTAVVARSENIQGAVHEEEWLVLGSLTIMTLAAILLFPLMSSTGVVPYVASVFPFLNVDNLLYGNIKLLSVMAAFVILLPLLFFGRTKKKIVPIYLAGANRGDDLTFTDAKHQPLPFSLRNWYMEEIFGENRMRMIGSVACAAAILIVMGILLGGVL